jgi:hypothetical protein
MDAGASSGDGLMTVGELARRTGMSIKAIRQFEASGLICSVDRSESNYRLFDETALLWPSDAARAAHQSAARRA